MVERLAEAPPDRRLREVLAEALPLDEPRRAEWRVWLAFWGQAADDEELQREQRDRYREWADLLGDLLDLAPDDPSVDRLIAAVDGIGIRATLDPDTFPPARQLHGLDAFLPDNR
jgi:TetR/AcrR family transcriptional repressor of bet genes